MIKTINQTVITCDICKEATYVDAGLTRKIIIKDARGYGWRIYGGMAICQNCKIKD